MSLSHFFSIPPPPPILTLFPYTTLFRSIDLARAVDRIDHGAIVGPEHAALIGHAHMRNLLAHAIVEPRGPAPPRTVLALAPNRADVVVDLVHFCQQIGDFLGWSLQVGVRRDDLLIASAEESG